VLYNEGITPPLFSAHLYAWVSPLPPLVSITGLGQPVSSTPNYIYNCSFMKGTLQTILHFCNYQKRFSQASLLISSKYFRNSIIMFSLELGYSVEKLDAAIQLSAQETYCISKWKNEISVLRESLIRTTMVP
jgi:hypothetical protein